MTRPCLGSNHLLASNLGLYRFKIGPKTTENQLFVCENSIDSKGYEWVNCTAWEPHLHCSNWVKSHIFEWNVFFSVHMVEKKSKINLWTSFDLIMIKTDVRNGPFRWYRQAYLTLFWKFWSPVKATKLNLFSFWSFRQFGKKMLYLKKNWQI